MRLLQRFSLALALLILGGSAAFAALTTANVNVRRAPGLDAPVVTTIPGGSNVRVLSCRGEWCSVRFGPFFGFVHAAYLDGRAVRRLPARVVYAPPPPRVVYGPPPPRIVYGPAVRPYWWGPRAYWGPRWRYWGW
jgi:hypothetical protein